MKQIKSVVGSIFLSILLLFVAGTARSDPATQSSAQLNSTAQLLAGIQPTQSTIRLGKAQREAWNTHSAEMWQAWGRVREVQMSPLTAWREAKLPRTCPVGKTLLYPFSGPDFFNAYLLFPDCENYVMFGLEHVGQMPAVEALGEREFAQLLADVRSSMTNLFVRNYFVTDTMSRQLRTAQLRGVVPVLAVAMSLTGVEVLGVKPLALAPPAGAGSVETESSQKRRTKRRLAGVTIEFRKPGAQRVQRVHYFSLDATDASLAEQPEFLEHLRSLGPTTMMLKSASYLLHGSEFRQLRSVLLDSAEYLIQDDTGLPYSMLLKRGWQVQLFGRYERPIPPFEYAFQPELAKAFEARKPDPLPFLFGYRRNVDVDRSHLMIGQRNQIQAAVPGAPADSNTAKPAPPQSGR